MCFLSFKSSGENPKSNSLSPPLPKWHSPSASSKNHLRSLSWGLKSTTIQWGFYTHRHTARHGTNGVCKASKSFFLLHVAPSDPRTLWKPATSLALFSLAAGSPKRLLLFLGFFFVGSSRMGGQLNGWQRIKLVQFHGKPVTSVRYHQKRQQLDHNWQLQSSILIVYINYIPSLKLT